MNFYKIFIKPKVFSGTSLGPVVRFGLNNSTEKRNGKLYFKGGASIFIEGLYSEFLSFALIKTFSLTFMC